MRGWFVMLGCIVFQAWAGDGARFVKLDESGQELMNETIVWACTWDRRTNLVWEIKTESGLRSRMHTFSWNDHGNLSGAGVTGTGRCDGLDCNTRVYATAINAIRLCGKADWRLPEETELFTLFKMPGVVNAEYFPDTVKASYWSSTLGPDGKSPVFVAFYGKGISYWHAPEMPKRVRLVSGTWRVQE